ncbi:MAG: molecular chaperone HtpG [Gammaproteobacteria bacterium]|nr:molecular chaperone HtpG [Gammaproteobacteria bacterium]NNL06657.1 molecular chaperone HtpG [Gammaproteobacteria bacterium]
MSVDTGKETLEFQTEARQILHLMTHSLYSNKEIFLRELISNASDACDKLRFEALGNDDLYEGDGELQITVDFDKDNNTVTVTDNGVGMSRDEIIENIGTIASSGTRKFLESLTGDQAKDAQMIGQFGVGFYSSFIVADKVTVTSRRAGLDISEAVRWESDGQGSFTLENTGKESRGTVVTLHLKEGEEEFADNFRLRNIIKQYSDHISLPIMMQEADYKTEEDKDDEKKEPEYERVNSASALWARDKKDITDDEYREFYKHVSHDFQDPQSWMHNKVEGNQSYTSLFYIPAKAPFDLFDRDHKRGIKLYVKRVFIMDDAEHLMPNYLRFIKGVVDSDDLPLNVSREILQQNKVIDRIRGASVKKVLGKLESMAKDQPEEYAEFWKAFGQVMKEGPIEDFANKDRIAKLLRFSSTETNSEEQTVSLEEYVGRMKEGQEKIYYITAESFSAAQNSPHLEVFRKKGIEVLLLSDRIDEWLVAHMTEFDGKSLQSVARGDLDLGEIGDEAEEKATEEANEEFKDVIERVRKTLGDSISEARMSQRLTDSPSCLVLNEQDMSTQMQQILEAAGQYAPRAQPILELNSGHKLVAKLKDIKDDDSFNDWVSLLFEQAQLAAGTHLEDPAGFVKRMNRLLES